MKKDAAWTEAAEEEAFFVPVLGAAEGADTLGDTLGVIEILGTSEDVEEGNCDGDEVGPARIIS